MMYGVMVVWVLVLLISGSAAAQPAPPTLELPGCSELTAGPGARACVPVRLEGRGASCGASVGLMLQYDTAVLRLPGGAADVQPGEALTGGQSLSAQVHEDLQTGTGSVQVAITPPLRFPIPPIPDGELCKVCFTVEQGAPSGCSSIIFVPGQVDVGDCQGLNIPVDRPADGGVQAGCQPAPEQCTGGVDEDCDGLIDCEDPDCNTDSVCLPDHFKCYVANTKRGTEQFMSRDVMLTDQFEEKNTTVVKPVGICNVDKGGEGIKDPATYLTCYQIKDVVTRPRQSRVEKREVVVTNQFGTQTLTVLKPQALCVPSEKNQVPSALNLDRFKCYAAKTKAGTPKFEPQDVMLRDQFETKNTTVLKPISLCNPVDRNDEGIKDPATYLTCYQIKDVRGQPRFEKRDVVVRNQFGGETLTVAKTKVLCVPSTKTELGPSSEEGTEEGDLAE